MINFSDSHHEYGSQDDLKKLLNSLIDELGHYSTNSVHGGLSPSNIQDIIAHLMYTENLKSLELKITSAEDNYHLNLEILNKEK